MAHEVVKGLYRVTPWHFGMSDSMVLGRLATINEAISQTGVDFGVTNVKLAYEWPVDSGIWVPDDNGFRGTYGAGKGLVGIHTDDYEPDNFGDHFRSVWPGDEPVVESMALLRKGRVAMMTLTLPDLDRIMPDGRKLSAHVLAYSSHDSTFAITLKDADYVVECMNMLRAADASNRGRVYRIKHTKNKDEARRNAVNVITYAQERADYHEKLCTELLAKKLTARRAQAVIDALIPIPDEKGRGQTIAINKQATVKAIYAGNAPGSSDQRDIKGTAWGLAQAFGAFSDHFATYRTRDEDRDRGRAESRLLRTVLNSDSLADQAIELLAKA